MYGRVFAAGITILQWWSMPVGSLFLPAVCDASTPTLISMVEALALGRLLTTRLI